MDKPAGVTSHDVVNTMRRLYRTKRIGHTGTLDPDATGVLVLCLGQATRLAEYLTAARKNYITEVVFGVETDTQDASGTVTAEHSADHLTEATVRERLAAFRGRIQQIPPMVSALHHEGRRLYELAREGVTVERKPRDIEITRLELLDFVPGERPSARLEVTCSTGTYIRTLAADIGTSLGTGGMMQTLRRTWVGLDEAHAFTLTAAYTLDELRARAEDDTLAATVRPLPEAVAAWPQTILDTESLRLLRHGMRLELAGLTGVATHNWPPPDPQAPVAVLDESGELCAIARYADGQIQPVKVFAGD